MQHKTKEMLYNRVANFMCFVAPGFLQYPVLAFLLLFEHRPYSYITGLYWNIADCTGYPEYWWDIQTKYKCSNWD